MIGTYAELIAAIEAQEPHRRQCEVRVVAGFETDSQRKVYIEGEKGVRDRRGDAVAEQLRRDVWALMKSRHAAPLPLQEGLFV